MKDSAPETSFTDALRRLLRFLKQELDAGAQKCHAEITDRRASQQTKKSG